MAAQTQVSGTIRDKKTDEPIPGVNIYLSNSQVGTVSEVDGSFSLTVPATGEFNLIFSHIGFKSTRKLMNSSRNQPLVVLLEEDDTQLTEVEVAAKRDKVWERKLRKFKSLFLGNDKFSKFCEILNPWVINFDDKKGGFSATANQVLKVKNNATGYLVTYLLTNFKIESGITFYDGLASYESLEPANLDEYVLWQKNRKAAYNGSLTHFLKSVLDDEIEANGFEAHLVKIDKGDYADQITDVSAGFETNVTKDVIFKEIRGKRYLSFDKTLRIRYYDAEVTLQEQLSHIQLVSQVAVDDLGNISNVAAMITYGHLTKEGFPYLLPLDYQGDGQRSDLTVFNNNVVRPYNRYQATQPMEQLYIHTDKDLYLDAETIWFKAYANVNGFPGKLSNKLYVQLMKGDSTLQQIVVPVNNGVAVGSLELEKGFSSGDYVLKAYTSWTQNKDPHYHFYKGIQIGLKEEAARDHQSVSDNQYQIRVFPEGGHLVNGVENRVAFEVTNSQNQYVSIEMTLVDDQGKEMQTVFPDWQGKGTFVFKPLAKRSYKLAVKNNLANSTALKTTTAVEVAMQAYQEGAAIDIRLRSSSKQEKPVHLLLSAGGTVRYFTSTTMQKQETISIDTSLLADGVNQITLFDFEYQPVAERLYFKIPGQRAELKAIVDRAANWKRGKTVVEIEGLDTIRSASLSVISNNVSFSKAENSVIFYNYLKPYVRGNLVGMENDQWLQTERNQRQLDLLMLVNGWRQYDWEAIRELQEVEPKTLELQEGFDIKGTLSHRGNGKPFINVPVFVLINDSTSYMRNVLTDEQGKFTFEDVRFSDSTSLIFKVGGDVKGKSQFNFTFEESAWNSTLDYTHYQASPGTEETTSVAQLDKDEILKISNFDGKTYYLNDAVVVGEKSVDLVVIPRIYSFPNNREKVVMDSIPPASRTSTFNLLNQYFPSVKAISYYTDSGLYRSVRLTGNFSSLTSNTDMQIYVDNFPVDVDYLYNMNPLEIETFEILRGPKAAIIGSNSANGVVVIYTKREKPEGFTKAPDFYETKLKGYQDYLAFYSPDHSVLKDPTLDYRTTLHWEPMLTNEDRRVTFY
ncbi:MAG: carboxypeptidase-like regulatory domain-containing protein, partial [Bacteroidota bacterium]